MANICCGIPSLLSRCRILKKTNVINVIDTEEILNKLAIELVILINKGYDIDHIYVALNQNYKSIVFPYKILQIIINNDFYLDKTILNLMIRENVLIRYLNNLDLKKTDKILLIYRSQGQKLILQNNGYPLVSTLDMLMDKLDINDNLKNQQSKRSIKIPKKRR